MSPMRSMMPRASRSSLTMQLSLLFQTGLPEGFPAATVRPRRLGWANMLARVFAVDVTLITDRAAPPPSATKDVDVIVTVSTNFEDTQGIGARLRDLGFSEDSSEDAPLCRWRRRDGALLDVMPTDPAILGFSNRWFPLAFDTGVFVQLPSGRSMGRRRCRMQRCSPRGCGCREYSCS